MYGVDDTRPEALAAQIALLGAASASRRASIALSLSRTICALSRAGIRRREPELSDEEVGLRFVELHYGAALGARVRDELARQQP
jgi:hypothetical protein